MVVLSFISTINFDSHLKLPSKIIFKLNKDINYEALKSQNDLIYICRSRGNFVSPVQLTFAPS
jgi:hypothetical protein